MDAANWKYSRHIDLFFPRFPQTHTLFHGPKRIFCSSRVVCLHTHHKDGSPGSQCVACHMPKIETEGVPGSFVSAHTFKFITPAMTEKYQMPNACTSCHKDKTNAWATDAMSHWSLQSPWTLQ